MKGQITPGPWKYEPGSKTIRSSRENYWLATMDSWDGQVDNAANGRLIAAAPELLEALKSCYAWMEFTIPTLHGRCPSCDTRVDAGGLNWGGPISKARNSIAKATGQTAEEVEKEALCG